MTVATKKPSIHERLAIILDEMPAIGKDARNPNLNFNYRSVDAILDALNPLLGKHGVFMLPEVRDVQLATRQLKNSVANVAVVTVAYHFVADDGTEVVAISIGEGQDSGDKSVSKALTMALKSCLGQVFAISTTEDDPDGDSIQTSPAPAPARAESRSERAEPGTAPPAPPADPLVKRRQDVYELAKALDAQDLNSLKEKMAAAGIGMDFAGHTEDQVKQLEDWLCPL